MPWAEDNPAALRIPFVADMVREDLGPALTAPASGSADEIAFIVQAGDTPRTIAPRLAEDEHRSRASGRSCSRPGRRISRPGSRRARIALAGNLTPEQVVDGLVDNRIVVSTST